MWRAEDISLTWITGALVVASLILYGLHPIKAWRLRRIPGPRSAWLIGNFGSFLTGRGIHLVFSDWSKQYGSLYKIWWGASPSIVVTEPEVGRLLILRNGERLALRGAPDLLTGRDHKIQAANLVAIKDKTQHRDVKNAWFPMFNSASLEASCTLINECSERLCSHFAKYAADGQETNAWRDYGRLTMGVVGTVAFGVDFHTQDVDESEKSEAAKELIASAQALFTQNPFGGNLYAMLVLLFPFALPILKPIARVFPDAQMRKMAAARERLYKTSTQLLEMARLQASQDGKEVHSVDVAASASATDASAKPVDKLARKQARAVKPGSFMHLLMSSHHTTDGSSFTDTEIIAQAFIFLLAGYETTANTLAFTTYALASNPDKVAKLVEEIDRETPSGEVTAEHLVRMPYVDACIKEALRLYPPAVLLGRQLGEDTTIKGHVLPKGTGIMVPAYTLHHDPAIYADAEAFKPERWIEGTPEYAADKHMPGKWMPFGEGTRVCIGQRLALMEAKIALAHVFRRFTFKLSPGQIPLSTECTLLLKPKHGVFVTPILRKEE
ncbi:g4079 [Coccomyxa elongata]